MVTIIKEVDFGIANTYKTDRGYVIEVNYKLQEFPSIRKKIIDHEFDHTKQNSFFKQRKVDALTNLKFMDMFPIYKKYPKLFFQQHIPVNYSKEKDTLFIEWSLLFLYAIYSGILVLIYFLICTFSTDSAMFWKISKVAGIILGVSIILSFLSKRLIRYLNKTSTRLTKKS